MTIDKIIFAVDDNPKYLDLWGINSEICKKVLGITPVLFHITDEDSDFYEDEFGLVKKVKKLANFPTGFQSQIYRMYGTQYFEDDVCLTSDIDMLTISKPYITDQIKDFDKDDLVIFVSDAYDNSREECVGIYSEPRISMCYNAAKGKTFHEVLNTKRDFDSFATEVFNICYDTHDSDEIYLGSKVKSFNNQNRIKRLRRGYTSPFVCPNRNDRPRDENFFNNYSKSDIKNGNIIDIHLSRPYLQHKKEIDELREIILRGYKEIYVIGCHVENDTQLNMVKSLTEKLHSNGKDFIITTHTMIPDDIIKKSKGFIYDSENPKYKIWDLPGKTKYVIDVGGFSILSPYVTYGRVDYYHVGPLRQIVNAINLVKTMDYDVIHWMDYDAALDFEEEKINLDRLLSHDMVFYGVGPKFSFKVDKVNKEILTMKNEDFLNLLSKHDYVIEKVFGEFLINGNILFIEVTDPIFWGNYSQNFDEIKFDWSFFELNGNVNLFVNNNDNMVINFNLKVDGNKKDIMSQPYTWFWTPISLINEISDVCLSYSVSDINNKILLDLNMKDGNNYRNIIKSVKFTQK